MTYLVTIMVFIVPIVITFGWVYSNQHRTRRIEKRVNEIFD